MYLVFGIVHSMGYGVFGIWNEVFGNRMVYLVIEMVYMVCVVGYGWYDFIGFYGRKLI